MRKSAALIIFSSMMITIFASAAITADNNIVFAKDDAVEIYGPVYNGSNLTDIIARQGSNYVLQRTAIILQHLTMTWKTI